MHSEIVEQIARKIIQALENSAGYQINKDLVFNGIALHDVGVYSTFDEDFNNDQNAPNYLAHGEIGYDAILTEFNDVQLARIALTHTGIGGITADEIQASCLPIRPISRVPLTVEEQLVSWEQINSILSILDLSPKKS